MRDKRTLAAEAIHVEQNLLGEAVGAQDQISTAYGGFNRISFGADGSIEAKRIVTSPKRVVELEQHLALHFAGFSRIASEIAQEQLKVTRHKKKELEAMLQLFDEAEKIVIDENCSLDDIGRLVHESRQIKRTLTEKISNPEIDAIYEAVGAHVHWEASFLAPAAAGLCCFLCLLRREPPFASASESFFASLSNSQAREAT